jgi:hypothetical protein
MVSDPTSSASPVPSPGIKTHSSPAAFPTTLSLPFVSLPPLSLTYLHCPLVPLRPRPSSTYSPARPPCPPTEPIQRGQWEKCRSATAGSHSLDASAALPRRLSDQCVDPWTVTPVKRPAFQQVAGGLVMRRPQMQDSPLPFELRPPIHHTASCLRRGRPRPRQHADWLRHRCVTTPSSCCRSPPQAGFGQGSGWG